MKKDILLMVEIREGFVSINNNQEESFKQRLSVQLNPQHELLILANKIILDIIFTKEETLSFLIRVIIKKSTRTYIYRFPTFL